MNKHRHTFNKISRPKLVKAGNAFARYFQEIGLGTSLSASDLLQSAQKKVDSEFKDESFAEALGYLCHSLDFEANLHPLGRVIQQQRLFGLLVNRLRLEQYQKNNPGCLSIELPKLVIIAGLQRTGTTMLHRLLAADPSARSLKSWEALNPFPIKGESPLDTTKRLRQAKFAQNGLKYLAPQFFAIHPIEAEAPEEEILLLDQTFMTQTAEAILSVPRYANWLERQDHLPAYRYLKTVLQALHHIQPNQHWVLKTPHHLEHWNELFEVFPNATVIQTHRDPVKTMGSFCSMVYHGRAVCSDYVDPVEIGSHWLRKTKKMIDDASHYRNRSSDDRIIDIQYRDLIDDPIQQIRYIYDDAGLNFTSLVEKSMKNAHSANKKDKFGKHHYALGDFGLSAATVNAVFSDYKSQFNIPDENY